MVCSSDDSCMNLTRMTIRVLIGLMMVVLGGVLAHPVQAAAASSDKTPCETGTTFCFKPEIPIPGSIFNDTALVVDNSLLANYVKAIFIYFIWVVGIVATVMVVYGGIRWVAAAGNAGQIKEARDIIDNAIIGVIIGLCSVVLLNIINPKLTKLSLPGMHMTVSEYVAGLHVGTVCKQDLDVECGKIREDGTAKVDGKDVKNFCIGTKCAPAKDTPTAGRVCDVQRTNNLFAPGAGCIGEVKIETTDVKIDNRVVLPLTRGNDACGEVNRFATDIDVGTHCTLSEQFCYQIGPKAQYNPTTDTISNMCCPGFTCPAN